jgi:hypothetical protein
MSVLAKLEPRFDDNRRTAARRTLSLGSVLATTGAEVIIHDLSISGLLIETSGELSMGENLLVEVPERGPTAATVMWTSGRFFGCAFDKRLPVAAVSAALLRNPIIPRQELTPEAAAPAPVADIAIDDRYSPRARILIMTGLALGAWVLVYAAIVALI